MNPWKLFVAGMGVFVILSFTISIILGHGQFLIWLADHRSPVADYFFYYITKLGEEYGFVVIGVIFLFRSWRRSLMILALGLIVTLITFVLKKTFYFERPSMFLERMVWEGPREVLDYSLLIGHSSFPSGHSMAAWALFTFIVALYRKSWVSIVCFVLAISVSISRVYLMAHFLRDVAMGAFIGFLIGYLVFYIYDTRLKIR